jgi:hypothetical protein
MSDGKDDTEKGRLESTEISSVSFEKFLETVPPGEARRVADVRFSTAVNQFAYLRIPQLNLHCEECDGIRTFQCSQSLEVAPGVGATDMFMEYICSNCGKYQKNFALRFSFPTRDDGFGDCVKFGEIPPYGQPTPTRLLRLFGDDKNQFLKGRRSENERLGFGAFAYYRRVVESHKDQILDEIIKAANEIAPEMVGKLEAAKAENQFLKAIDSTKDALPQALFVNGHNPLTLLHSALSKGLHANTDKQCLEAAHDVRIALAELTDRIGIALKDEAELNAAISRLTNKK